VNMFNSVARNIYYSADASFEQLVQTQQPTTSTSESHARSGSPPRKSKFCAFMAFECDKPIYPADAALRTAFFDLMGERYQSCEAIGRCRNSTPRENLGGGSSSRQGSAIDKFQPYRFVLSFENMLMPGKTPLNHMLIPGRKRPTGMLDSQLSLALPQLPLRQLHVVTTIHTAPSSLALPTASAEGSRARLTARGQDTYRSACRRHCWQVACPSTLAMWRSWLIKSTWLD
jgi:hypothetical protein